MTVASVFAISQDTLARSCACETVAHVPPGLLWEASVLHAEALQRLGNGGLVRRFGDGDAVLKFGHVLPFKPRGFGHGHGQSGLFFRFDRPRQKRRWHDRGFVFKDPPLGHLRDFRDSIPRSQTGQGGGLHSAAPPEALLRRLEQMGFRHVPELLRESSR
jgi:hypothetical protein